MALFLDLPWCATNLAFYLGLCAYESADFLLLAARASHHYIVSPASPLLLSLNRPHRFWLFPAQLGQIAAVSNITTMTGIKLPNTSEAIPGPELAMGFNKESMSSATKPTTAHPSGKESYGILMQIARGISFAVYFLTCCALYTFHGAHLKNQR